MIWGIFIIMVLGALVLAWFPFYQKKEKRDLSDVGVMEIYISQLREVEVEEKGGLINSQEAKIAQNEIKRRMLRASNKKNESSNIENPFLIQLIISGAFIFSFIFYLNIGSPELTSYTKNGSSISEFETDKNINELLEKLETHLLTTPNDTDAWVLLGDSRLKQGNYFEAARAYGNAFDLSESDEGLLVRQGEALVNLASGQMTPAANLAFGTAMKLNPDHPAPKYYLGLARYQNGNIEGALDIWKNLIARSNKNDPWYGNLQSQITRAQGELNVSSVNVENMTSQEQDQFIEGMISSLREKLENNPDDLEGWLRLARAEIVKGRLEAGIEALTKAEQLANGELKKQISQEILSLKLQKN